MKITNVTLAIAALTLVAILAIVAVLIYTGRAPDQIVYLIVALVGPMIPGAANYVKTQRIERQVQDVQGKVNGRMTQLIEKATTNGHDLPPEVYAGLDTPPAPVGAHRAPDAP